MQEVTAVLSDAYGFEDKTIVETVTEDETTAYVYHVRDGEIEKVEWESQAMGDYGTKLLSYVDDDVKNMVKEAARNV